MQQLMGEIYEMQKEGIDPLIQTAYLAKQVFEAKAFREGDEIAFTTSQLKRIFFLSGTNTVTKCR